MNVLTKTVAVIPARAGSKGVPGKNTRLLGTRPLVSITVEQAKNSSAVDLVVVSTDGAEIAEVAARGGARVIRRPSALATDTSTSEEAIAHAIEALAADAQQIETIVFLQVTSPFRSAANIDEAVELFKRSKADSLVSVSPSHRFIWRKNSDDTGMPINYDPRSRPRRQDMEAQYVENGSIYVFSRELFEQTGNRIGGKTVLYVMDETAAFEIDSELDLKIAAAIFEGSR